MAEAHSLGSGSIPCEVAAGAPVLERVCLQAPRGVWEPRHVKFRLYRRPRCSRGFETATVERTAAKHRLSKAQHAAWIHAAARLDLCETLASSLLAALVTTRSTMETPEAAPGLASALAAGELSRRSPFSPTNTVTTEWKSDPVKTK